MHHKMMLDASQNDAQFLKCVAISVEDLIRYIIGNVLVLEVNSSN